MKRILTGLALALLTSVALAADNTVIVTPGAGVTMRTQDVGTGIQSPIVQLGNNAGTNIIGAGTTVPVSGTVTATGTIAATQSGTWNIATVTALTGITNPVAVTQSGTWNITNVSGTVSLPTGASTSANQPSAVAAAGAATSGSTGNLAMGAVTTGSPTYTTANTNPLSLDTSGNLRVNVVAGGGAGGTSSTFGSAFPGTGTGIGFTDGTNMVAGRVTTYGTAPTGFNALAVNAFVTNANANGRAVAGSASPVVMTPALTTFHLIAANTTNATSVKASAATLYACQMSNNSTTAGYLKIYNKASAPTVGTDVPVKTLIIPGPAAGGGGSNISFGSGGGLTLGTGFALAVTSIITDADTTAPAAATFAINCDYE